MRKIKNKRDLEIIKKKGRGERGDVRRGRKCVTAQRKRNRKN